MSNHTSDTLSIEDRLRTADQMVGEYFAANLELQYQLNAANARTEVLEQRLEWAKGMMQSSMDQRQMLTEHNANLIKQVTEMGDGMREFAERHWTLTDELERKCEDQKRLIQDLVGRALDLSQRLEATLKIIEEGEPTDQGNDMGRGGDSEFDWVRNDYYGFV